MLVPMVIEETTRGERAYDIYSRLQSFVNVRLDGAEKADEPRPAESLRSSKR
jgi:hypothetical protein